MNPTSYTYGGITVQFNETQRALLQSDSDLIARLNYDLIEWDRQIGTHTTTYNNAVAQINSYCPTLSGYVNDLNNIQKAACQTAGSTTGNCLTKQKACFAQYENIRDIAEGDRLSIQSQKTTTLAELERAKQKLNDDIITIQNAIKFQIQAQIANTTANTQGASNQVALNNSTPEAIALNQARAAAADKLKQEQTVKVVAFFLIAVTVITLGVFLIRKIV